MVKNLWADYEGTSEENELDLDFPEWLIMVASILNIRC